jgi:hypothetical protein
MSLWLIGKRWMPVLGTHLSRKENKLFGAISVVVLIDDKLKAHVADVVQTEVGYFDVLLLVLRDRNMSSLEERDGSPFESLGFLHSHRFVLPKILFRASVGRPNWLFGPRIRTGSGQIPSPKATSFSSSSQVDAVILCV